MRSHGYVPTACVQDDRIRVFAAFWDTDRKGRIGFVDLDARDPTRVLGYAPEPVLDLGVPGAFDEHGVTPMAIVADGPALRLYYAGWQRTEQARYLLFTGLATSTDRGASFTRRSNVPVLDRTPGHHLVRTGFIDRHGATWKAWIAESDGMTDIAGKPTPTYGLSYIESPDGIAWPAASRPCFRQGQDGVFGFGRSAIWRDGSAYHAMLSVRRRTGYVIEYARSADGISWSAPETGGYAMLPHHTAPPERETMFPSVVNAGGARYAFYNGNEFGKKGIRCARWFGDEH